MSCTAWVWTHLSFTLVVATAWVGAWLCLKRGLTVWRRKGLEPHEKETEHRDVTITSAQRAMGVALALVLAGGMSIASLGVVDASGWLLAHIGELSFATLYYLIVTLVGAAFGPAYQVPDRHWHAPQWFWAVAGLALYGAALTGRGFDLYSTGYGSPLAWMALAIAAAAAMSGRWLIATLVLGVVVSWQMRLSGAVNGWDYALDPFIFVGSVIQIVIRTIGSCVRVGTKRAVVRKLEASANDVVPANG